MTVTRNEDLLDCLDSAIERHLAPRTTRLLRNPVYEVHRFIKLRVMRRRMRATTATPFFGGSLNVTVPPAEDLYFCGIYVDRPEVNLARHMILHLRPGDTVFDIGANFGFYTLLSARLVGDSGMVHAFEPSPTVLPELRKSVAGLRNVRLVEQAACNSNEPLEFYFGSGKYAVNSTLNPDELMAAGFNDLGTFGRVTVPTVRLDDYCEQQNAIPAFIKIDVEGAEEQVLLGAQRLLRTHSPAVVLEIWFSTPTPNYDRAIELLRSLGYRAWFIGGDGLLNEVPYESMKAYGERIVADKRYLHGVDNLLFRK